MEIIIMIILGAMLLTGGGMYAFDPKGWNATGRRLTTMVRANLESGKATKELAAGVTHKELLADWDNQFEGKDLVVKNEKPHEIVKTRLEKNSSNPWHYWWCRCGVNGQHISVDSALRDYKTHLSWVKEEEARKQKQAEYKRKGLDREW